MSRYRTIPFRRVDEKRVTSTSIYPEVAASEEDYYIISTIGDRFDILSQQFYGSSEYWWILGSANPNVRRDTLFITPGIQLRVPPYRVVKEAFESLNRNR